MRDVLDALAPQLLVELRVQPHVLGTHRLLRKVHNGLDRPRRTLLEGAAVYALVHVNGVLAGDDVGEGGALARLHYYYDRLQRVCA